jgi:acyl-CoA hydrolase
MYKSISAEDAVKIVKSNNRVYLQAAAAAPQVLIRALSSRHEELRNVEICQLHTEGEAPYANPDYKDSFHVNSFFVGKNIRHTLSAGNGSYTPVFLSELPLLFKRGIIKLDVAFIHVSPPDKHGYCSLGVSVEATLAAIDNATYVVAQVNPQMPRTHGDGIIHITEIDIFVDCDEPIPQHPMPQISETEKKIGDYVASLI